MVKEYEIVFRKLEEFQVSEAQTLPSESEQREAEEIQLLRQIVAEIQDQSDSTYYTST